MSAPNRVVSIYTEATPNPQTMKFVLNRMLFAQNSADFPSFEAAEEASPLAAAIFKSFPFVGGVFIMNNFVTVSKATTDEWYELIPELREFIRNYVAEDHQIINLEVLKERLDNKEVGTNTNAIAEDDTETVKKIKEMLTKYVQPAVESDGGSIVFRSYTDGVVHLGMQGSCSGCPSSTVTLKAGIEGLLKRMVPEVQSVEAEML